MNELQKIFDAMHNLGVEVDNDGLDVILTLKNVFVIEPQYQNANGMKAIFKSGDYAVAISIQKKG